MLPKRSQWSVKAITMLRSKLDGTGVLRPGFVQRRITNWMLKPNTVFSRAYGCALDPFYVRTQPSERAIVACQIRLP
jgi:hypothetical protein